MDYNITLNGSSVFITTDNRFSVSQTLLSGQCFRFSEDSQDAYTIIAHGKKLHIKQSGQTIEFYPTSETEFIMYWVHYFDLDKDYSAIQNDLLNRIENNSVMHDAIAYAPGIHIMNQEPWECLISFIISQNNNIPRIKSIIEKISRIYGSPIDDIVNAFPTIEQLSHASEQRLRECGVGYRGKYIIDAAQKIYSGEIKLDILQTLSTDDLSKMLMTICGVGQKVADCTMLFSFKRTELFPIDVWVKRVMEHFFFEGIPMSINEIHSFAKNAFGLNAGYAQQYLFHYARQYDGFINLSKKKK